MGTKLRNLAQFKPNRYSKLSKFSRRMHGITNLPDRLKRVNVANKMCNVHRRQWKPESGMHFVFPN